MVGLADVEKAIWDYLGGVTLNPAVPISYPSIAFPTPKDSAGNLLPYLDVSFHPNMAMRTGIEFGSSINHRGLVQINVHWPSGQGEIQPMIVADQIARAFAPGSSTFSHGALVRFEQAPDVASPVTDADETMIPVTISWRWLDD